MKMITILRYVRYDVMLWTYIVISYIGIGYYQIWIIVIKRYLAGP